MGIASVYHCGVRVSSTAKAARVLLDMLGVFLGIAGAAFEEPQVAGEPDVVAALAVTFAAHGVALLPAAAVVEVRVCGVGYVAHGVEARMLLIRA